MTDLKKALIIDDEEGLVSVMTMFLEDLKVEVHSYGSVDEYLQQNSPTELQAYSYMVIDHNLPGTKGLDFLASLDKQNYPAKIIVTSGEILEHEVLNSSDKIVVLTKPFDFSALENVFA